MTARPESVTITLGLPPKALQPNARPHWRTKAKHTKAYRRTARLTALLTPGWKQGEPWEQATIQATFYHKQKRRRDDVNFLGALKPAYDGLVDAGLLEDDDAEHLTTLGAVFKIDKALPRVELLVTRVDAGPPERGDT